MEFEKINNNILLINKEGKYIENNEIKNYIIADINIKENNQIIRIINSYEECNKENPFDKYEKEYENEKEIKDNCEIRINDKIIKFVYFYEFKEKGKYNIKYIFKNNIKNCNHMFYKGGWGIGDWGLGIGDWAWGLGIGANPQTPNPKSQTPIPKPHIKIEIV